MKDPRATYQSVFTARYGSSRMREVFSDAHRFRLWRKIWVSLASAQNELGLVTGEELADLKKHEDDVDIDRILAIEIDTQHDVVSALREFAEKAKKGGKKLHLGATSQDIQDNAETLRNKEALFIIEEKCKRVLSVFADKISGFADTVCMGYTHLQPAEPTTLGYRFGVYAQDLLIDLEFLHFVLATIKGKGIKGAVGTGASYEALVAGTGFSAQKMEEMFCTDLGLTPVLIASQVNPRKYDFLILSALCSIAQSLSKFAFDLRIMQSPGFGEWAEPFGSKQVGSSAMPFKKNPLQSEKICSLGRYVSSLAPVAWENASLSLLERTLDDSANKRIIIPEAFLAVDEMLKTAEFVLTGLEINLNAISQNLDRYGLFSATERVIIEAVKKGAGRQEMHELLRNMSMKAWQAVAAGKPNPMRELLLSDKTIGAFLEPDSIEALLDVSSHVGSAPRRVRALAEKIREVVVRTGK